MTFIDIKNPFEHDHSYSGMLDDLNIPKVINSDISLLRIGQIRTVDLLHNSLDVWILSDKQSYPVEYPGHMADWSNGTGLWYGFYPGDLVLCIIGYGNKYVVINKIGSSLSNEQIDGFSGASSFNSLFYNTTSVAQDIDFKNLSPGDFLMKSSNNTKLTVSKTGAVLGNRGKGSLTFDTTDINASQSGTAMLEANQKYEFSNSGYSIEGIILRDRRISNITGEDDPAIESRIIFQWYKDLQPVAFDPSLQIFENTNSTNPRNPAFIEQRNVIFEFSDYNYNNPIESDQKEAAKQSVDSKQLRDPTVSRRARKSDSFSLSLISPNYLIEEIKGTAVDALGNIIDLNRTILPIGNVNDIGIKLESSSESYYKVRELQRKSIAFHWELNARKDKEKTLLTEIGTGSTYGGTDDIYKKNRSRFFLDIDKEGQLKLNVPASSEKGNISVLTRYENFTNIHPNDKKGTKDYDYFNRTDKPDDIDILLDSIGKGIVDIKGNEKLLPKDRNTNNTIKLGTMYHDISTTCVYPPKGTEDPNQGFGILSGPDTMVENFGALEPHDILEKTITDDIFANRTIITKTINIDGAIPNAGGRSATLNFEGMISASIGANTIDRQSLWLDTQGGIISRIGADKNGISLAAQTDGDVYLQVGGVPLGIDPDRRFQDTNIYNDSAMRTNRFEVRVIQGNGPGFSRILIDNRGIIISTPENMEFRAERNIVFYAGANMHLNCESLFTYSNTVEDDSLRISKQSRNIEDVYSVDVDGRMIPRNSGTNPVI